MKSKNEGFTRKKVAERTGLTERQVLFFTERGVVTPEIDAGEGRGKTRVYSEKNLVMFMIIRSLAELGITISRIAPVVRFFDRLDVWKQYQKFQPLGENENLYVLIHKDTDGNLTGFWRLTAHAQGLQHSILNVKDLADKDECIVINFSRIAAQAKNVP